MVPVYNTHFNRGLCPSDSLVMKHGEFFRGWSAANKPITPEETFKEVDRLKSLKSLGYDAGVLFGRVQSYQGLIFLNAEFGISKELFQELCHAYR